MSDVVIFGAGDIARLARFYFSTDSEHRVVAFTVDRDYRTADRFEGLPLVDFERLEEQYPSDRYAMFIAVSYTGMNRVRAAKYEESRLRGYRLVSYVSSRCTNLSGSPVGDNCFILEDNTIQPFVRIGSDVTLWSGNHIGHDSVIEDHVFISSQVVVSGHVRIGAYSFLGVNATLRNGITLAPSTLVGAGAVVMGNTQEGGVYVPPASVKLDKPSDKVKL